MADDELVDALAQTAFAVMAVLSKLAAENDFSLTQLRVLGILRDRRVRMTGLADYLGLEKSTMSGLVDRAAQRGLLARAPSPTDGRVVEVYLTRAGTKLADQVYNELVESLAPMTGALSPSDQRRAQMLLQRMIAR